MKTKASRKTISTSGTDSMLGMNKNLYFAAQTFLAESLNFTERPSVSIEPVVEVHTSKNHDLELVTKLRQKRYIKGG
jgi:hypothetical protein